MKWTDWVGTRRQKLTIRNYEDGMLSHMSFDAGKHDAMDRSWKFITQHFHPSSMKNDGEMNRGIDGFTEEKFRKFMEEHRLL